MQQSKTDASTLHRLGGVFSSINLLQKLSFIHAKTLEKMPLRFILILFVSDWQALEQSDS